MPPKAHLSNQPSFRRAFVFWWPASTMVPRLLRREHQPPLGATTARAMRRAARSRLVMLSSLLRGLLTHVLTGTALNHPAGHGCSTSSLPGADGLSQRP